MFFPIVPPSETLEPPVLRERSPDSRAEVQGIQRAEIKGAMAVG